jgi:folylpolyglutamate synthase
VSRAPRKIGLYTSPHLRFVRERIQINGSPLSEDIFARYFFETWDRLEQAAISAGEDPKAPGAKPLYFRFLTLMAFHTYLCEGVDCAVIECGIGGAHDSTNLVPRPAVTGITSLGIDHVSMLGDTIESIAWHKAGIMKYRPAPDEPLKCFTTTTQQEAAKAVLQEIADEQRTELILTPVHPDIASGKLPLGLEADFQHINASLALAISTEFLTQQKVDLQNGTAQECISNGLASVSWPGRCDTRVDKLDQSITWYIDGGHTLESIELAGRWFGKQVQLKRSASSKTIRTYLIFNQQTRDASALATALYNTLSSTLPEAEINSTHSTTHSPFNTVIFTTNTPHAPSPTSTPNRAPMTDARLTSPYPFSTAVSKTSTTPNTRDTPKPIILLTSPPNPDLLTSNVDPSAVSALTVQKSLAETWKTLDTDPNITVEVVRSVSEAISRVRDETEDKDVEKLVLVTGSLHLVGAFLEVLEGSDPVAS